jgi:hypothetical protein
MLHELGTAVIACLDSPIAGSTVISAIIVDTFSATDAVLSRIVVLGVAQLWALVSIVRVVWRR